ncbi:MAG: DUF2752 domain-containing protein [Labilithrix sp.]|nr:DUF2752 domain-containing protein [Labilithrix sp.]MBX3218056.1 DUF2752 domain-containing protein [Labilithrix sp.]
MHVSRPEPFASAPPAPLPVRLRRAALTVAFAGAVGGLLYAQAIPCVFASLFHTPCPGCGSTRAVLALARGDVHDALRYNAVGPVMALFIGIFAVQAFVSVLTYGDVRDAGEGRLGFVLKRGILVLFGLELLLWIARLFGAFGGPVPV